MTRSSRHVASSDEAHPNAASMAPRGSIPIGSFPVEVSGRPYVNSMFFDVAKKTVWFIAGPLKGGHWGHDCVFSGQSVEQVLESEEVPRGLRQALKKHLAR